jgi:hypothetical protein
VHAGEGDSKMIVNCGYGYCTMVNLCQTHCVRRELEAKGWLRTGDGTIKQKPHINKGGHNPDESQVKHRPPPSEK